MINYGFHGTSLRKQMCRTRHNLQRLRRPQPGQSLLIEFNDARIIASNDQQCWRANYIERGAGQVGAAAPRNYRSHPMWQFGCCDKCSCRSGACTEQSKRKPRSRGQI